MPYTPRRLNVLRVEDDPLKRLPEDLCVKDLGRIGRWAEFVLGLAENTLRAATLKGEEEVFAHPDFITIDHRFEGDQSVPRRNESDKLHGVEWSHKLKMPNTGILIGATLQARYANHDVPTVALPHSGVPGDFAEDLSTVLLLAQMQAQTIDWNPDRMVAQACDTAQRLPRLAQDAIRGSADNDLRKGIDSYRTLLLRRLGVPQRELGEPLNEGPRLMIDAEELIHLLAELDNATDEADLNQRLDTIGLKFWTRDGVDDCLDLRSLFLDHVTYVAEARKHVLPIECVKVGGLVHGYLSRIHGAVATEFTKAAEFVLHNADPMKEPKTPDNQKPHSWKLLALVFATVEAWMKKAHEVDRQLDYLDGPWNPWEDCPSVDKNLPTLRELLDELLKLLTYMQELTDTCGPWPLSGDGGSILAARETARKEKCLDPLPLEFLYANKEMEAQRTQAYQNLLERVVMLGSATRIIEDDGVVRYKAKWPHVEEYRVSRTRGPITLKPKEVAWFMGYREIAEVDNQLIRPARYGGYSRDPSAFVSQLLLGQVPAFLRKATFMYLERFHRDAPDADEATLGAHPDWPIWAQI